MRFAALILAGLSLVTSNAHAQPSAFEGKWNGLIANGVGARVKVTLTIRSTDGVLRVSQPYDSVARDPCADRDLPVVVNSATKSELVIAIKGEDVLRGCIHEVATLTLKGPKALQGTLQDGRTVKLTRK